MARSDEERVLSLLNFGDLLFLRNYFEALPLSESLSDAAKRLDISKEENLHHRLKRILKRLNRPPVNAGTKLTRGGEELSALLDEIWRAAGPILPASTRQSRRVVRLAMPEVMTGRSFVDLLRRINNQPWGSDVELVMRRLSPERLAAEVARQSRWPDDLVMTLSSSRAPAAGTPPRLRKVRRQSPLARADLRRVLLVLNNDPLVGKERGGSWFDPEDLRGRSIYLPPARLWPDFPVKRLGPAAVHVVRSFVEAHAYALTGRGRLAAAHPELLDEVEDELCDTIPLGPDAGFTRLELHRYRGATDPLVGKVFDLVERHLVELNREAERAEELNRELARYTWIAYTSDAPPDGNPGTDGGPGPAPWRWRYSSLSNFRVTALGNLKGRHGSLDRLEQSFHLSGRVMHTSDGWYHILWRSVDDETGPGDFEPRVEHFSVNFVFDGGTLKKGRPLVGLWSGRRSGPPPWEADCGVIMLATRPMDSRELSRGLGVFRGRLHLWRDPPDAAKSVP